MANIRGVMLYDCAAYDVRNLTVERGQRQRRKPTWLDDSVDLHKVGAKNGRALVRLFIECPFCVSMMVYGGGVVIASSALFIIVAITSLEITSLDFCDNTLWTTARIY